MFPMFLGIEFAAKKLILLVWSGDKNESQGKVKEPHLVNWVATLCKILIVTMKSPGKVLERCI